MRKEKFVYNPNTLQWEKTKMTKKEIFFKTFGFISVVLVTSLILQSIIPSPKNKMLKLEISQLESEYNKVNQKAANLETKVSDLKERDNNIYRMIFGMDPISNDVWEVGVGGHDMYSDIAQYSETSDIIAATRDRIDKLDRQLNIATSSIDTIEALAINKERMLSSIPSIKPIREDKLKKSFYLLSGYGMRLHPVHKIKKMHKGIDFTAPRGTHIQATGDGVIKRVQHKSTGFGNNVIIDHGYGYETLYAHMKRIDVKVGQKVKKGQEIGIVGSTGTSTAPHCHYEVHVKGKAVNPINYCMDGLTPEEYQQLVDAAEVVNQSLD